MQFLGALKFRRSNFRNRMLEAKPFDKVVPFRKSGERYLCHGIALHGPNHSYRIG
jgi:hypothetical protein